MAPTIAHSGPVLLPLDRKSTRLNSSHVRISYAVFCLKKKTKKDVTSASAKAKAKSKKEKDEANVSDGLAADRRMIFFFNDTAPTEIYTLSLHDALPIWVRCSFP